MKHDDIWVGLTNLAKQFGVTPSKLARLSGLDPTAFNFSKRFSPLGRERWPSTETLAKALEATNRNLGDFANIIGEEAKTPASDIEFPIINLANAQLLHAFTAQGLPAINSQGKIGTNKSIWEVYNSKSQTEPYLSHLNLRELQTPEGDNWGLRIDDSSEYPILGQGSLLIISSSISTHKENMVVIKQKNGQILLRRFLRQTIHRIEVRKLGRESIDEYLMQDIAWISRVLWIKL